MNALKRNPVALLIIVFCFCVGSFAAYAASSYLGQYGSDEYGSGLYGGLVVVPALSNPLDSETGQTTAAGSVVTDESGGTLHFVVTDSATTPSPTQIIAGQNHTGTAPEFAGFEPVSNTGLQNITANGLSSGTGYFIHYVHESASGNASNAVSADGFTTDSVVDVLAPVLTAAVDEQTGSGSATISVSTDEANGTLYFVITATVQTPSATQIIAGQDSVGGSAAFEGSQLVTTAGVQTSQLTGLTQSTAYFAHFLHIDASSNQSNLLTADGFTTVAATVSSGGGGGGGSRSSSDDDTDEQVDVSTIEATGVTPISVDTTLPATDLFKSNVSFIQPQLNVDEDVRNLQIFLNDFEGESLFITGVYDDASNAAMKRFQTKYRREILDVWNLQEATGFVGITTRLKMNFLLKGTTAQCPVFVEYNGGISPITVSPEIQKTKEILADLNMFFGPIDQVWTPQTHEAMIVFQETFREVMLDPWNIDEGTGYKYKTTNKFLNYFAGCDTGAVELEGIGVYEGI